MTEDRNIDAPATSVINQTPSSIEGYVRAGRQDEKEFQQKIAERKANQPQESADDSFYSDSEVSRGNNPLVNAAKRRKTEDNELSLDLSTCQDESTTEDSQYVDDIIVNSAPNGVLVRQTSDRRNADSENQKKLPEEQYALACDKMNANKMESDSPFDEKQTRNE